MKSKKSLIALALVGVIGIGGGVGAGTYAYFTSQATSTGNTITAGILDISKKDANDIKLNLKDVAPSHEFKTDAYKFKVLNSGNIHGNLKFKVNSKATATNGTDLDVNVLRVMPHLIGAVNDTPSKPIPIDELANYLNEKITKIEAGKDVQIVLDTKMDYELTGNQYQGANFTIDITADAIQSDN